MRETGGDGSFEFGGHGDGEFTGHEQGQDPGYWGRGELTAPGGMPADQPNEPDETTEEVKQAFLEDLLKRLRAQREAGRELPQGVGEEVPQTVVEDGWTTQKSWLTQQYEGLFSQTAAETIWRCAAATANLLHPGAGHLIIWAYRAAHVIAAAMGASSGRGFDLTIDFPGSPTSKLAFAFSIQEMQSTDRAEAKPQLVLDVSFTEFASINDVSVNVDGPPEPKPARRRQDPGTGWDEWIELFGNADAAQFLNRVVFRRPMDALADLTNQDWYAIALALHVTLDREGRVHQAMRRNRDWQRPNSAPIADGPERGQ